MSKFIKHRRNFKKVEAKTGDTTRACAALIVNAIENGTSFNIAFDDIVKEHELDDRDRAFVSEIVYGTLRHRRLLNKTLEPYLAHKIQKRHAVVKSLIICAFYQLVFMRTPPHAVVSSTVSACALCNAKGFVSMVNAILRSFLRDGGKLTHSAEDAIEYSFPNWLYSRIKNDYKDKTREILVQSNEHAPMFLRLATSKISLDDYLKELDKTDIDYALSSQSDYCIEILEPVAFSQIPLFDKGFVTIQDLSAQKAAPLLDLQDNMKVLDTCCAPGGKTAHILDLAKNLEVTALDIDEKRLKVTQKTLERMGVKAELKVQDCQDLSNFKKESFDRILVDAPCSGTGVIRRHPDIKWLRRDSDIQDLCKTQEKILNEAFALLKKGGILVYTTCSILKCENEEQIKAFLQNHKDAKLVPFKFGDVVHETYQELPNEHSGDGFFYSRVTKI